MHFYFLFSSQSWIPPLSKYYRYLQSLHALHPHYHITAMQQQRADFTHGASVVLQLFREAIWAHANEICSDSTPSSGSRPYRFSISLSRPLQLLAPQQITRFGRLHSDTFNNIRKGKKKNQKKINQKTSFTITVAYATTDMRSSE